MLLEKSELQAFETVMYDVHKICSWGEKTCKNAKKNIVVLASQRQKVKVYGLRPVRFASDVFVVGKC